METTPYKVSKIEKTPILTLLVDSINARNAHWVKDEILHFIKQEKPSSLLINLNNVQHIGHIGLGALIAINNQIRQMQPHAFVALSKEVQEKIQASHLDQVFQIWTLEEAGRQMHLKDPQDLTEKIKEFPAVKFTESQIPHLGEKVVHAPPPPPPKTLDLTDMEPVAPKVGNRIGMIMVALVIVGLLIAGTWFAAQKYYSEGGLKGGRTLSTEEVLNKYDRNHDGQLTQEDLSGMSESELFFLSFPPYCKMLKIKCSNGD